ncbi:MAG: formylglycine-generating enzyme family protein [Bacteroidales bacterium]|nr:formylglycine-generating enzyme family protein [Bacteroidales bacterium]
MGSVLLVGSCGKDPLFEQGDYIYENNDFTRVDNVNGFIIHWADDVEISEEQQAVILNLIANLVRVEGGTFMMGAQHSNPESANYDPGAADNESPVHQVTLSDYYIGKYEVTQREWRVVMGYDLDWPEVYGNGDDFPVYNVSRTDAVRFLEKLSALTRLSFHLPSEAQWEYAARGGSYTQDYRFSGSDDVNDVAWHNGNAGGILHSVGEKQSNELGLYDMSGNVWEWCLDTYGSYPDMTLENPVSMSGDLFVLRGGSWTYLPGYSRVTCRDSYGGNASSLSVGFRVSLRGSES